MMTRLHYAQLVMSVCLAYRILIILKGLDFLCKLSLHPPPNDIAKSGEEAICQGHRREVERMRRCLSCAEIADQPV